MVALVAVLALALGLGAVPSQAVAAVAGSPSMSAPGSSGGLGSWSSWFAGLVGKDGDKDGDSDRLSKQARMRPPTSKKDVTVREHWPRDRHGKPVKRIIKSLFPKKPVPVSASMTPSRMGAGGAYEVPVTVKNTTRKAWAAGDRELAYAWSTTDGDPVPGADNRSTEIPALKPGKETEVKVKVKAPAKGTDPVNARSDYVLAWDLRDPRAAERPLAEPTDEPTDKPTEELAGEAADGPSAGLTDPLVDVDVEVIVSVEEASAARIGLESFYAYQSHATGAGSSLSTNLATGNGVWQQNLWSHPGRGLSAFARVAYNSLDGSDTGFGPGWSTQLSGPIRTGARLDAFPLTLLPTQVRLPDGDGTTHVFRRNEDGSWRAPAGVNYRLKVKDVADGLGDGDLDGVLSILECLNLADPMDDYFTLLRPDGTQFMFGCDGYLTKSVDKNGNTQVFSYERRLSLDVLKNFLTEVTDPSGRTVTTLEYNRLGGSYRYINDAGNIANGALLANLLLTDKVTSITDVSGRKTSFLYDQAGYLRRVIDGEGTESAKTFKYEYADVDNNLLTAKQLVAITDPRGNTSQIGYYNRADDPNASDSWGNVKTFTDRLGDATGYAYAENAEDSEDSGQVDTTVTDAETNQTRYTLDDLARPVSLTNAKDETTTLAWDADHNVRYMREPNGAERSYCYDPKTGYPVWVRDAVQNDAHDGAPAAGLCDPDKTAAELAANAPEGASVFEYQTRADGYAADIFRTTSPEGRASQFSYDERGNLLTVTDGKGLTTSDPDDYTTRYAYDTYGQVTKATDANGNATTFTDYGPTGYPATTTDALDGVSSTVYDDRGLVTEARDAAQGVVTQAYDVFERPRAGTEKVSGERTITTPAPVFDANDNVTRVTAPNGAVSRATYDDADQVTETVAPKDIDTGPDRVTTYAYDKVGNLLKATEPKGVATTDDPDDYVTSFFYDKVYQQTAVENAHGDRIEYSYDQVGNQIEVRDPLKTASEDPDDFTSKTEFDLNHVPVKVTDADGNATTTAYDADGLSVSVTNAAGHTSFVTYDERGARTESRTPWTGTGEDTRYRTTRFEYDEVGNQTRVITPRGVATTSDQDDFAVRTRFDELNRPVRQYQPYDPDHDRYNDPDVYTETSYDAVGRITRTSLPPSKGQKKRNTTSVAYYANGWIRSTTDNRGIKTAYEYDDLGLQTARTLTGEDGSATRTMNWGYYPDGKLRSRGDEGVPVGSHSVVVDNDTDGVTTATGEWETATADGEQGTDHRTHAAAAAGSTDTYTWTLDVPADGTYALSATWPTTAGAATDATYTLRHGRGDGATSSDYPADQSADAGAWNRLTTVELTKGEPVTVTLKPSATGVVSADAVRLVRDNSADTDNEHKAFAYAYDLNGNLTTINDTSTDTGVEEYTLGYDGLNQITSVREALAGQDKATTTYDYNPLGQPVNVRHPAQTSTYVYNDPRHLLTAVTVDDTADDKPAKTTKYTHDSLARVLTETKGNNNVLTYAYQADGAAKSTREETNAGGLVASHEYTFDANGNKLTDEIRKRDADNDRILESAVKYTYDPVDRLSTKTKTGHAASSESYVHDANANVISQTIDTDSTDSIAGDATSFKLDRNRLTSVTVNPGDPEAGEDQIATYRYDPFGRQTSVIADPDGAEGPEGRQPIARTTYDGFDHVRTSEKQDDTAGAEPGDLVTTRYTYDPLDRRTSKTTRAGTDKSKKTDYGYLGLAKQVIGEEVAGQLTKSYQYSPWGQRLSQITQDPTAHEEENGIKAGDTAYYGYNGHTDVETITGDDGETVATYGYTAYGQADEDEITGIDKPDADSGEPGAGKDPEDQYNAFRYNATRWDPATDTYDMGFRDYAPSLNTFTTRDTYNGALDDLALGIDPYTASRYAYGAGNPISMIELDGHRPIDANGNECASCDSRVSQPQAAPAHVVAPAPIQPADSTPARPKYCGGWGIECTEGPAAGFGANNGSPRDWGPGVFRSFADLYDLFTPGNHGAQTADNLDRVTGADSDSGAYYFGQFVIAGIPTIFSGGASGTASAIGNALKGLSGRMPRLLAPAITVSAHTDDAAKSGDDLIRLSTNDSWANMRTLDDHFARHGADFGARSADEYASMASEFFQRGGAQQFPTKIAPDGTVRMFDPATSTFGSFAPNGLTKTFFKPTSPTYWDRQPGVLQ